MSGVEATMIEQLLTAEVMAAVDPALEGLGIEAPERARESFTGYLSWVQPFGSTAGPFEGIGGAAVTDFRLTMGSTPFNALS
jgi:hypothetical protein